MVSLLTLIANYVKFRMQHHSSAIYQPVKFTVSAISVHYNASASVIKVRRSGASSMQRRSEINPKMIQLCPNSPTSCQNFYWICLFPFWDSTLSGISHSCQHEFFFFLKETAQVVGKRHWIKYNQPIWLRHKSVFLLTCTYVSQNDFESEDSSQMGQEDSSLHQ